MNEQDILEALEHADPMEMEEIVRLAQQAGILLNWSPQPKQQLAWELAEQADLVLYGGAAGGGKTEWLLQYFVHQMKTFPNNRGIIFRRVFPSLNRSVIPRLKEMLKGVASYNSLHHVFTFENGSSLELGSLQYADDVLNFQGAEYGLIGFEEITEFLESQVLYMIGRLRSPAPDIRPHMVATANPGGVGHDFVKEMFIEPHPSRYLGKPEPCTIFRPNPTPIEKQPLTRVFIPATLADNPILLERDPNYMDRLMAQTDEGLREAMANGDWDLSEVVAGALAWTKEVVDRNRVRPGSITLEDMMMVVIGVDPSGSATGDTCGIVAAGIDNGLGPDDMHHGYLFGDYSKQTGSKEWGEIVVDAFVENKADRVVAEKNFGGDMVKTVIEAIAEKRGIAVPVKLVNASRGKRPRAEPIAERYKNDQIHHVGEFPKIERQFARWTPESKKSPDEMDAVVWAFTDLLEGRVVSESSSSAGILDEFENPALASVDNPYLDPEVYYGIMDPQDEEE